jgi:hypothetical protein
MKYCKPDAPTDYIDERELNQLKEMMADNQLAVAAAMDYCVEHEICPPQWLVAASAALMVDLLKREKSQKRGRSAGYIGRYRQSFWDIERWDAVLEIRRMRKKVRHNLRLARDYQIPTSKHDEKMRVLLGNSLDEFEIASSYLAGRDAKAGPDAMRASYRRVRRKFADPETAKQTVLFTERFLRKIGLQGALDQKPGTKRWPLCSLPS